MKQWGIIPWLFCFQCSHLDLNQPFGFGEECLYLALL